MVIPYDYKKAVFMHDSLKGYRVTLYLIFDGKTTYTFFHQSEWIENFHLINEISLNSATSFTYEILVTPSLHKDIFHEIEEYEKCVLNQF